MPPDSGPGNAPAFVELPTGLFTASGTWFHITLDALRDYAPQVLERIGIERLIVDAEHWLRSPATVSLWLFALGVLALPGWQALLAAFVWFAGWSILAPGFVNRPTIALMRLMEPVWLQGALYVGALSWIAAGDRTAAAAVGLGWFILVRWGLVDRWLAPLLRPLTRNLYRLPVPDQVLRAVIIRHALAERLPVPQVDAMERRMMDIAHRHRGSRGGTDPSNPS